MNDQVWELGADGSAIKFVSFDTYDYRVYAKDYHTEAGKVTVNDPNNTQKVMVTLKPNFGWIEVSGKGELQGANVFVDDSYVGKAPCKSEALKSGTHAVRIIKEMYATYNQTVRVNDNETTTLTPSLSADFAEVTLKVDADAEIWVNDERKGLRTWKGRLGRGTYKMECRQASHESTVTTQEITAGMTGQTITLPAPTPIYGSLNVESNPNFAKLYIDGQAMGETPKFLSEILVGQHTLKLTKDGYSDYIETITIIKDERKQVTATMNNGPKNEETFTVNNALKSEVTFMVNGVSFTMKLVEGGSFQMGATSEQGSEALGNEKPVHNVTLSNFYLGEAEVTQELWKAVMGSNPSYFIGDNLPVEQVSWKDVQDFVRKLNQITGKHFRLPTEAEWEYAARGGKKSKGYKYAGSNTLGTVAWYKDNSGNQNHVVKTKSPNELGLYDMSGNVWEWCQDWYGNYSSSSQTNPTGPSNGSGRVLRGGSWFNYARHCRVSYRNHTDGRYYYNGFRLALSE